MASPTAGFESFRDALPPPVLRWVDPGGAMADTAVQQAVAVAVAALMLTLLVRVGLRVGRWIWLRAHGWVLPESTSRPWRWARQLTGAAAVLMPWLALWVLHTTSHLDEAWFRVSAWCFYAWTLLRAADHHRLVFDLRQDAVVLRRGVGLGPMDTTTWPLGLVLVCADGRALPPRAQRPPRLPVVVQPPALDWLVASLGSPRRASEWLRQLADHEGLLLTTSMNDCKDAKSGASSVAFPGGTT